jgi:hypothetical protein
MLEHFHISQSSRGKELSFHIFASLNYTYIYPLLFTHQASLPHAYGIASCGVRYCMCKYAHVSTRVQAIDIDMSY